jgi:hypothetical protein
MFELANLLDRVATAAGYIDGTEDRRVKGFHRTIQPLRASRLHKELNRIVEV